VLFVAPLSFLSVQAARISFATIGGAVLGFAIGRDQFRRIGLVFSAAFMIAIWRDQWSPFILAAFTLPAVALAIFAKPNLAVVYLAGRRTKREWTWILSLSAAIVAVSTAIRPTWMTEWWGALSTVPYVVAPVMRPGGFLLLAAVLRWKRPDARVLLALACVPQTPSLYDLLPLFIIARTTREVALLTLLTNVLFGLVLYDGPFADFNSYAHRLGNLATFVVYLPMLLLVLRRPNVSADAPSPTLSPTESAWRARLHALSTVDAMLLLVNAASAALLAWVSTSSPRP
jgi:hypothetical protein